jgi:hypothetical protein
MSLHRIANDAATTAAAWVPTPTPAIPAEVQAPIQTVTSWVIGIGIALAVVLVAFCGAKIMAGRTGRSSMGADGVTGIVWVIAGLTVIAMSGVIAQAFL